MLTFLTYDGQWQAMNFNDALVDRPDHLISGELDEPFTYFAVAGPLDPTLLDASPKLSVIAPEPSVAILALTGLALLRRRRSMAAS